MEVFEAVRTLLAVRQFQDKPLPEPVALTLSKRLT